MSILRRNPRVDSNQSTIVKELRDRGALVVILGQPVDLLVGYRGEWALVEVKAGPRSKIQPSQTKFLDQCRDNQVPCFLLDDLDDVDTFFPLVTDAENGDPESAGDQTGTDQPLGGPARGDLEVDRPELVDRVKHLDLDRP